MDRYFSGDERAHLEAAQVTADWGRGEGTSRRVSIANKAFDIYYESIAQIRRCGDRTRNRKMLEDLRSAAREGWGFGVDDLEEAFAHLISNGGRWTDDAAENYYPGPNKVYPGRTIGTVAGRYQFEALAQGPRSCVLFLKAVDDRMDELREIARKHFQTVDQALQDSQWQRMGDLLEFVDDWGSRAEKLLWWAPEVQTRLGAVNSYTSVLSEIHSALTDYATLTGRHGRSGTEAVGFIALKKALEQLPILGAFYVKALEMIPNAQAYFQGQHDYYRGRIEQQLGQR